jgi:hypothetical protein
MKPLLACPLATVVLARDLHRCSTTNKPVLAHRFHESVPCDVFRVDFAKEIDTRRRFVASDVATCTDNVLGAAIGPDVSACPDNTFGAAARSEDNRSNVVARPDIGFDMSTSDATIGFDMSACPDVGFEMSTSDATIGFDMSACPDNGFGAVAGSEDTAAAAGPNRFDPPTCPDDGSNIPARPDDRLDKCPPPAFTPQNPRIATVCLHKVNKLLE